MKSPEVWSALPQLKDETSAVDRPVVEAVLSNWTFKVLVCSTRGTRRFGGAGTTAVITATTTPASSVPTYCPCWHAICKEHNGGETEQGPAPLTAMEQRLFDRLEAWMMGSNLDGDKNRKAAQRISIVLGRTGCNRFQTE